MTVKRTVVWTAVVAGVAMMVAVSGALATEITVRPGQQDCPAASKGCYVNKTSLFTCTSKFCGNWKVYK
jgi:hypothetical protein